MVEDSSRANEVVRHIMDTDFFEHHASRIAADPNTGCWHWTGAWMGGDRSVDYGRYCTPFGGTAAHRAAYIAANGPVPDGMIVRHKCDVGVCVNPDHLELGTLQDNVNDMFERGRSVGPRVEPPESVTLPKICASRNGRSKLTQKQIDDIRLRRAAGESCQCVADRYGVTKSYVSKVARGIRWLDGGCNA